MSKQIFFRMSVLAMFLKCWKSQVYPLFGLIVLIKGLVNECNRTLFKHSKFNNCSFKKSIVIIFNAFNTQFFM